MSEIALFNDRTSLFTPNPFLNGYRLLTVNHNPDLPNKIKKGYIHQAVRPGARNS